MQANKQPLETLQDIRNMMERSSRFISLSGWSGVAAGVCALVGAWFAGKVINASGEPGTRIGLYNYDYASKGLLDLKTFMGSRLFGIAIITFIAALAFAFIFTYVRSKKNNIPVWGTAARRVIVNVSIPMFAGAVFLLKMIQAGIYGLISPGCLIFYGLGLVNASKYTLGEVRYLGYGQIILGLINCWYIGFGLYFWAAGFGVLHIVYGLLMWWKYERNG